MSKKYTSTICVGRVFVVIAYFLLEKQTFNGFLKVIGIQRIFCDYLKWVITAKRLKYEYYLFDDIMKATHSIMTYIIDEEI